MIDLGPIKRRLADTEPQDDVFYEDELRRHARAHDLMHECAKADITALVAEVERLRTAVPTPLERDAVNACIAIAQYTSRIGSDVAGIARQWLSRNKGT